MLNHETIRTQSANKRRPYSPSRVPTWLVVHSRWTRCKRRRRRRPLSPAGHLTRSLFRILLYLSPAPRLYSPIYSEAGCALDRVRTKSWWTFPAGQKTSYRVSSMQILGNANESTVQREIEWDGICLWVCSAIVFCIIQRPATTISGCPFAWIEHLRWPPRTPRRHPHYPPPPLPKPFLDFLFVDCPRLLRLTFLESPNLTLTIEFLDNQLSNNQHRFIVFSIICSR